MDIFDKAKETLAKTGSSARKITHDVTEKARNRTLEFLDDEKIASMVEAATKKQEKVNRILEERGSAYRLGELSLEIGIPPSISFVVKRTVHVSPPSTVELPGSDDAHSDEEE